MKYTLTPKGWENIYCNRNNLFPDGSYDNKPLDDLLLHLIKSGRNALIWTGREWVFENVKLVKGEEK